MRVSLHHDNPASLVLHKTQARAGDGVDLTLADVEPLALSVGNVLCSPGWPVLQVLSFEARLVVLEPPIPIIKGQQVCDGFACELQHDSCALQVLRRHRSQCTRIVCKRKDV